MSGSQFSKDGDREGVKSRVQFFQVGTNDRRGIYNQAKEFSIQKSALK